MQYLNNKVVRGELQHKHTHFDNPHGMASLNHYSTAWELGESAIHFLQNAVNAG